MAQVCAWKPSVWLQDLHPPHPNIYHTLTRWPVSVFLHLSAREDQCNRQDAKVMETLHKYPWNSRWERSLTCLAVNGTWCMKACRESPPLVINLKLPFLELMTDLPMPHKSQFYLDLKIPENLASAQDTQTLQEALSCDDSLSYKKIFCSLYKNYNYLDHCRMSAYLSNTSCKYSLLLEVWHSLCVCVW